MKKLLAKISMVVISLIMIASLAGAQDAPDPSTSEILKFDPDHFYGSALLITDAAQACWNPDNQHLAYTDMPEGIDLCGGIMVLKLGDSTAKRLTNVGKDPIWSPDGRWIAYVVEEREREKGAGPTTESESVWIIKADGAGDPFKAAMGGYPSWMPDSETLVFHDYNTKKVCMAKAEPNADVKECFDLDFHLPRVSDDGRELVSEVREEDVMNLRIFDLEGNVLRNLINAAGMCSWIPNSSWLIYGGWSQENGFGLHAVKDAFDEPPLLIKSGSWNRASVSPDGRFLTFDTMTPGELDIYIANFNEIKEKLGIN
ncbi:MAG: PD40 domain-containing protein [Candidatus Omnitrophica bacterium]|nr:PD40 domain-containing protein [Candidatus Omnitrophota bacterium]